MSPAEPLSDLARLALADYLPGEYDSRTDRHGTYRRGRCAGCGALVGEDQASHVRHPAVGPGGLFCGPCHAAYRRGAPPGRAPDEPSDAGPDAPPDEGGAEAGTGA